MFQSLNRPFKVGASRISDCPLRQCKNKSNTPCEHQGNCVKLTFSMPLGDCAFGVPYGEKARLVMQECLDHNDPVTPEFMTIYNELQRGSTSVVLSTAEGYEEER